MEIQSNSGLPEIEYGPKSMYSALKSLANWNGTFSLSSIESLTITDISNILWSGQGENRPGRRVIPSAGATYPLDIYILFYDKIGPMDGLFGKYDSGSHSITKIKSLENLNELTYLNKFEGEVLIFITSTEERTSLRYGDRTNRYINLEIGHTLENIRLEAWSREINLKTYILHGNFPLSNWFPVDCNIEVVIGLQKDLSIQSNNFNLLKTNFKMTKNTQSISVEQVIQARVSIRDYYDRNISLEEFQSLTYLSLDSIADSYAENTSIFIGNSNPDQSVTRVKFVTGSQINGLQPGIYGYSYATKNISLIKGGNFLSDLSRESLNQIFIKNVPFNVVIEIPDGMTSINEKIALFEAGIIAQRLYHSSYLHNFGMVVVGAFYDYGVNTIVNSDNFKSVYVIPIGPIESSNVIIEFYYLPTVFRAIGGYLGYISLFIFMILGLLQNKYIRRRLNIRGLSIHKKLVFLAFLFGGGHILLVYGYYFIRNISSQNAILEFLIGIIIPPELLPTSRQSFGLFLSKLSVYLFLLVLTMLYPLRFINSGFSYTNRAKTHKIVFSLFIITSFFHSYLNSMYLTNNYFLYALIILGFTFWLLLKTYQLIHKYKT